MLTRNEIGWDRIGMGRGWGFGPCGRGMARGRGYGRGYGWGPGLGFRACPGRFAGSDLSLREYREALQSRIDQIDQMLRPMPPEDPRRG